MEAGAIRRDDAAGTYEVDVRRMREAIDPWQGDTFACRGTATTPARRPSSRRRCDLTPALQADLDRLAAMSIPNAIRFRPAIETTTA